MIRSLSLQFVAFIASLILLSQPAISKEVPFLSSRVNDDASILSLEATQRLERVLKEHEDSTSNQVVILTVKSLDGESIEEFATEVTDRWKLGTKENDNGVLLLIAKDEHKVRIEVGDGLQGVLPDGICGTIIRQEIVPNFKEQRYDEGTEAGIAAILKAIKSEYTPNPDDSDDGRPPLPFALGIFVFFLAIVGFFTFTAVLSQGFITWFLYLFLTPFWLMFPMALFGMTAGMTIYGIYAVGFLIARVYFKTAGKNFFSRWSKKYHFVGGSSGSSGSSGWSSGSSGSSGSSFSGGGGSFSGGGSSGGW